MSKQKTKNKQTAKDKVILEWTDVAWDDYLHGYQNSETYFEKINSFIEECKRTPFKGIGKPEPLANNLTGYWSRRISMEHRFIYFYQDKRLTVIACRYRYGD